MTPTAKQIIERVAELYHTTTWGFFSTSRKRIFSDQRVCVCYLCQRRLKMCASEIARMMDKTHASVLHYIKTGETWMALPKINPDAVRVIAAVDQELFTDQ